MDIRNLGVFANIDAVWAAYPNGGREGDYLYIGEDEETGTKYRWNKYILKWENAEVVTETGGRQSASFSDIQLQNDLNVGGDIKVQGGVCIDGALSSSGDALAIHDDVEIQGNISADELIVHGNLSIEGTATAYKVDWAYKGRFEDETSLTTTYPSPKVGWWAQVGISTSVKTWRCDDEDEGWAETEESSLVVGPDVITNEEMAEVLG